MTGMQLRNERASTIRGRRVVPKRARIDRGFATTPRTAAGRTFTLMDGKRTTSILRTSMVETRRLWFAEVDLTPQPGNTVIQGGVGAIANVVALAASEADFRVRVDEAMASEAFLISEMSDCRPLDEHLESWEIAPGLRQAAADAVATGEVKWDGFYIYENDE